MQSMKQLQAWRWQLRSLRPVAVAFVFLTLADTVLADNYKIVPGHSLGKVWIGAKRDAAHKILGNPTSTHGRDDKMIEDVWRLPRTAAKETHTYFYKALYSKNRIVQLETNSPMFSSWGLSLRSEPYEIRRRFGRMRVSIYDCVVDERRAFRYFYDNTLRGIAFTLVVRNEKEVATQFQTVIVHRKRHHVLPSSSEMLLHQLWDDTKKKS